VAVGPEAAGDGIEPVGFTELVGVVADEQEAVGAAADSAMVVTPGLRFDEKRLPVRRLSATRAAATRQRLV
jgi:hypothetical protein